MKLLPDKIGAEPKKLAMLGGLVVLLGAVYWINRSPSEESTPVVASAPQPAVPAIQRLPQTDPVTLSRSSDPPLQRRGTPGSVDRSIQDFRPTLKLPDGYDVSRIDPSLHLDLLAKVRSTEGSGGSRSLFEFGAPPPPPAPPPPKVNPIVPRAPEPVASAKPVEPPKPPPPPITLKFYGYAGTSGSGQRRAFFLDGEDIFVAGENDLIKNRYKIVRIGVNSAVVEDTTNRNQQTLPLVQESQV